ncbi:MAG: hypothetical protein ACTSWX_12350 [Promethearchaeota archaeon]
MSQEDLKAEIRQLVMLMSSIRAKDDARYEEHVNFNKEIIDFIKKIEENMNSNWVKIQKSLESLNLKIEDSLDSLLTGINPEGIKETSKSLKDIMITMEKSITSMNLENVMRELRGIKGVKLTSGGVGAGGFESEGEAEEDAEMISSSKEIYGFVPDHLKKKKKKKKDDEPHLLKPSDFFGS